MVFLSSRGKKHSPPAIHPTEALPLNKECISAQLSSTLQANGGAEGGVTLLSTTSLWVKH